MNGIFLFVMVAALLYGCFMIPGLIQNIFDALNKNKVTER